MAVTPAQMNAFTAVVTALPKLIHGFREVSEALATAVDSACASLGSLKEQAVRHNYKVRSAYEDFLTAADKALSYVDGVDEAFQYSRNENRLTTIMEQLRRTETRHAPGGWLTRRSYITIPAPEYQLLKAFIERLKGFFAQVERLYVEFKEDVKKAITSTNSAAVECEVIAVRAQTQQEKTKWKGGGTTLLAAGVLGAAAGALAGQLGFLLAAGAVGAVGGVATHQLVKGYESPKNAFQKQHATLNQLARKGSEMQESARQVREALTALATAVDDIAECYQQNYETVESLCHNLTQMRANSEEWSGAVSRYRSAIQKKTDELKQNRQLNF